MRTQSGLRMEVKGLTLIAVIVLLIWLSVAIYQKSFSSEVTVTLETKSAGLQLNDNADVRMRGALIGRVTKIEQRNGEAIVVLALDPASARYVPANVTAQILPTTLFGQKYVELVAPPRDTGPSIQAGTVIDEDRSATATEITTALNDLGPVLNALEPQDLSLALTGLAQGLDGQGQQLGNSVTQAKGLLTAYIRNLPALVHDLQLAGGVSNAYASALPGLLNTLDNLSTTSDTVVSQNTQLAALLKNFTEFSELTRAFLDRNGDGIIEINQTTEPVLNLLARYAPELPCLLQGLVVANKTFNSAFSGGKLHSYLTLGLQYPGYTAADKPAFGAATGPTCAGLPVIHGPVLMPSFKDGGGHPAGQLFVP